MKTVKFYNVCTDEAAVEARGDGPLKKLIDNMGGWNVTGNMTSLSSMSITQRLGKVSSELFTKPFIDIKVFIDPHDSNKHILQVSLFILFVLLLLLLLFVYVFVCSLLFKEARKGF